MRIVLFLLGLFFSYGALAQIDNQIRFQTNIGLNISVPKIEMADYAPYVNYDAGLGFFIEFMPEIKLSDKVVIQSGLNYSYNRILYKDNLGYYINEGDIVTSYINIPIMIKLKISNSFPVIFSSGPYAGLLIDAKSKGLSKLDISAIEDQPDNNQIIDKGDRKYNYDIQENFSKMDFGIMVQLEYDYTINKKLNGLLSARINYGLKNVLTNNSTDQPTVPADAWRNISCSLGIGIKY